MVLSRLGALTIAVLAIGCTDATAPRIHLAEDIRVITAGDRLRVDNTGPESFFYRVTEVGLSIRALFPGFDTTTYPRVRPGESAVVTYEDLLGPVDPAWNTNTAVVYWWYAKDTAADGFVPFDKVRSTIVPIE
jgi:hypothetical protein